MPRGFNGFRTNVWTISINMRNSKLIDISILPSDRISGKYYLHTNIDYRKILWKTHKLAATIGYWKAIT